MNKRYWVSWYQNTEDYRPVDYPPNKSVLGWWCTGYTDSGVTLCAAIEATSEENVCKAIWIDWPEADTNNLRFCTEKSDDFVPGDRFPMSDWMIERFSKGRNK
jgi:hypothetical protein